MKQMWDDRYSENEYAYGKEPNAFFKAQINGIKPGKILLPAEGEGRNAVYAASLGWEVFAIDQSNEGLKKALQLAQKHKVKIHYDLGDILEMSYPDESFDMIALTYVHLPSAARERLHTQLIPLLKPEGLLILEGFSTNNLTFKQEGEATNGPKNPDFLFSTEIIKKEFTALSPIILQEETIISDEGKYHQGEAKIIRFLGKKA